MTALINRHAQRRENLFGFGLTLLCTLQQTLCPILVKISTDIYYYIFILIIEGQTQQGKPFFNLFLHFSASCIRKENKKEKQVAVLATAGNSTYKQWMHSYFLVPSCAPFLSELPAKSLDLAAINLTELVNGMLSTALRGTKKLFSLLSVTSYSSFAFHKVSVTIYNISNAKNIDPGKFPLHYCYCLNNVTNDLTDFTALLVDIIGNSTSYLTEIFKSTSILSVRQSNDSDCIYICVMAGQTGKNLSDFLEILEKSPIINYTFSSNTSSDLGKYILGNKRKQEPERKSCLDGSCNEYSILITTTTINIILFLLLLIYLHNIMYLIILLLLWGSSTLSVLVPSLSLFFLQLPRCLWPRKGGKSPPQSSHHGQRQLEPKDPGFHHPTWRPPALGGAWPHCQPCSPAPVSMAWIQVVFFSPGCPQALLREPRVTSPPITVIVQKINPCVMELCRFFQLCLCVGQRRYSRKEAMR
uniref:HERV-H LTR-associating 1 n=1 Tax=Cyanoderma ruficeps TaxID=181631 RepID=A0A8C3RBC5_9PASS